MKNEIIDQYGRKMNYLRISITDRCNLRCSYCMPNMKMQFLAKNEILNFEEMLRVIRIFETLGINKLRFTGGEPFVRHDFIHLLESVRDNTKIDNIHITSNGTLTWKYIEKLKNCNIKGLNISLDTLKANRFKAITRFDALSEVLQSIELAYKSNIPLKINTVFQPMLNADEILDIILAYQQYNIQLRFIEEMPFNEKDKNLLSMNNFSIESYLNELLGPLESIESDDNSTSKLFAIKGMAMKIGIINGYSRNFCDTCNRIRLNSEGKLKSCLYADAGLDLKQMLRNNKSDLEIRKAIFSTVYARHKNGFEAEAARNNSEILESMSKIGG